MLVLAVASIREGVTAWHCNSSGSNGIQLMTKLIEGLTPAVPDKAALCVCVRPSMFYHLRDVSAGFGYISQAHMMALYRLRS